MHSFLDEIEATLNCGIWAPTLLGLLVLPDACGAVEYPMDRNGDRYKKWYDKYVGVYPNSKFRFDGEVLWKLRNSMMHETSLKLNAYGYDRIFFQLPVQTQVNIHMCLSENFGGTSETTLTVSLRQFFEDMKRGVIQWLKILYDDTDNTRIDRMNGLIQLRPNGVSPHIVGVPVIA